MYHTGDERAVLGGNSNFQQLQNVEFTYTVAQGTVIANYLDEGGNVIGPAVPTSGDIDTPYTTVQKDIPGYTFKNVTGAPVSGNYQANDQIVNYNYSRNQGTVNITYIDDTTGQTLANKSISGPTGEASTYTTAADIATYVDGGYEWVSDDYPKSGVTFADQPQSFVVHLKHKIVASSESKAVNQTIHYVYANGNTAADDHIASPVQFTRSVTTDQVTGDKTYGAWTPVGGTTFAAVTSPTITGYTPDQTQIDAIDNVTGETADIVKTVIYTPDAKPNVTPTDQTPAQPSDNALPNTGAEDGLVLTLLGAIVLVLTFGMINLRKKRQ